MTSFFQIENGVVIAELAGEAPRADKIAEARNQYNLTLRLAPSERRSRQLAGIARNLETLSQPDARTLVDAAIYSESVVGAPLQWPRAERARRLAETDWTQAADVDASIRDRFSAYRAALRDLPNVCPDPLAVVWPSKPSARAQNDGDMSVIEETFPEAAAALAQAGWKPHDGWGVYTRGTLVMGFEPSGQAFHVKNFAAIPPGDPRYSADTPDTADEAAAWLIARFPAPVSIDPAPEAAETAAHETHGETGEAAAPGADPLFEQMGGDEHKQPDALHESGETSPINEGADSLGDGEGRGGSFGAGLPQQNSEEPIDAEFTVPALETIELIEPSEPDFGGELLEFERETQEPPAAPEPPLDRFIGLDDLDRRRSLRMGDVMRYARSIMPTWGVEQDAELAGLRNFAMGVSEGRWADDPAKRDTLDALEAQLRRIRQIETARDQRVEFLEAATREEVEAFVVEADWP